jgi:hypothetical protein
MYVLLIMRHVRMDTWHDVYDGFPWGMYVCQAFEWHVCVHKYVNPHVACVYVCVHAHVGSMLHVVNAHVHPQVGMCMRRYRCVDAYVCPHVACMCRCDELMYVCVVHMVGQVDVACACVCVYV